MIKNVEGVKVMKSILCNILCALYLSINITNLCCLHCNQNYKLTTNTLRQQSLLPVKASDPKMESVGAMSEVNWNSFNAMTPVDEYEYMRQLLGDYENEQGSDPSFGDMFWSVDEAMNMVEANESLNYCSSDMVSSSCLYSWSQCNNTSPLISTSNYESYYMDESNVVTLINEISAAMDLCIADEPNTSSSLRVVTDNLLDDIVFRNNEMNSENAGESSLNLLEADVLPNKKFQPKRKMLAQQCDETMLVNNNSNINTDPSESQKKKLRVSSESSSSCSSEDNSNSSSQEINGASSSSRPAALNLNGKTRASRGTATDPQSLYARKRRERINERLRILQNLVPNGTTLDISTMLEEAVQYVKFLQLQIKLLSSDDLWMYAPIAYNGMDIGLDLKMTTPQ